MRIDSPMLSHSSMLPVDTAFGAARPQHHPASPAACNGIKRPLPGPLRAPFHPPGIPDFRSPGTGLYHRLEDYGLPHPEARAAAALNV